MSEEQIKKLTYDGSFYQKIGDFQRGRYSEMGFIHGTLQEVDYLIDFLQLPEGARVLDVGCGAGRHSLEFARRCFRPVGVDSPPASSRWRASYTDLP